MVEQFESADFLSDTFIAECLLDTRQMDEALNHILWVAQRCDGYAPDLINAAELLLKYGYRDEALSALRNVAKSGDEYWVIVDAASILYENERTSDNRQMLADLCTIDGGSPLDNICLSTLSRLMAIGEDELALPHLEAAIQLSDRNEHDVLSRGDAIEAARLIAAHHNRVGGKQILERMFASCGALREKAEIASALADLGFEQEAKSALRSSLQETGLKIEWFTVDLLIRLGFEGEVRSAVEAAVTHLGTYETVNLIKHALPVLNKEVVAAQILSRARAKKEPGLAHSLALLGVPEEGRSLLADFLRGEDIGLCFRAAGKLCELGDARLGRNKLRAIICNKDIEARTRLSAAETLKQVGFFRYAAIGFARIAQDPGVEVKLRACAAVSFDELEHERNHIVWVPLMEILEDRARPVVDRVEVAEALVHIDGEDGYDDLVYPKLFAILDDDQLSYRDVLCVGRSLGEFGWSLDEIPRLQQALTSAAVNAPTKIPVLRALGRGGRNAEVASLLLDIAKHPDASIELSLEAIAAIWRYDNPEAQDFLDQIVQDATIPPAWRLKAAKERAPNLRLISLLYLAGDASIHLDTRISALEDLPKNSLVEQTKILSDIACMAGLTFWERKKMVEVAHRLKIPTLITLVIQSAKDNRPLSIWEMVELAQLCRKFDDEAGAEQILQELLSLPLVVLENTEDLETAIKGIQLSAELNRDLAVSRLEELLFSNVTNWGAVADILEALTKLVGKEAALEKAAPIIEELCTALQTPTDGEYSGWPYQASRLLKKELFEDYQALIAFAENKGNEVTERAKACVLVMRYASNGSLAHTAALHLLSQFRQNDLASQVWITIIWELRYAGYSSEVGDWLDLCLANLPDEPDDRWELANLLHSCGRIDEAKALVENIDASILTTKGRIFPTDKALVESVLDEDDADETTFAQIMNSDDPFEQLWCAKEYLEAHGDRRALKLISDAANGYNSDSLVQLEAIDCLDALGFRELSRELFAGMPKRDIEPYWLGAQLLRFGKKAEAAPFYIEASRSNIKYNENMIRGRLADLKLDAELIEFCFRQEVGARPH
ncbi:hypothetical protein [Carnimonas nigrificans]|uniref:hypothetical protein n=1 Tax=Carnimonas nigrificans TaxID=64323 RepID=UPI000472E2AE|nr:hypothetical protein [Carnimonas nigrificans]